jgi:hypothetical protein
MARLRPSPVRSRITSRSNMGEAGSATAPRFQGDEFEARVARENGLIRAPDCNGAGETLTIHALGSPPPPPCGAARTRSFFTP